MQNGKIGAYNIGYVENDKDSDVAHGTFEYKSGPAELLPRYWRNGTITNVDVPDQTGAGGQLITGILKHDMLRRFPGSDVHDGWNSWQMFFSRQLADDANVSTNTSV